MFRCPRLTRLGLFLALPAALVAPVLASSHREAPLITEMPQVDGTDFYMFRSYEAGREGFVTLIANYVPLQDAYGGPNYFALDPDALYNIHIDNTGDGVEDTTFQFRIGQSSPDIQLPVGSELVSIPLKNAGPGPENLNFFETYVVGKIEGRMPQPGGFQPLTNVANGSPSFVKPMDNIGQKSFPDYAGYASQFIHDVMIPGCGNGRVFVGQRRESFAVNLGEVFDLVNIADPLGARDAEPSATADKNITSFILEVPIDCLTDGTNPVIGGWTTAHLPLDRAFQLDPSFPQTITKGARVPVSRLGMPLVNEVVIGLKDKDLFNTTGRPEGDAALATYVTNPTLPELLEILFGAAGVVAPNNFPRNDLVAAFATGIEGLNFLSDGAPHEMLRLNTSIPPVAAEEQNNLGALGGDNAGFPNGRRPGDDVVDIELRVAMGVLCHAFPGVFCVPSEAPSGALPFTDGTLQDASQFDDTFPYLTTPLPGSPNGPNGLPGATP